MDERTHDHRSDANDDLVRGALLSLRGDVDRVPLPEPQFVRSRGDAQLRRRLLGMTAGVAAAVIVVGALGFRGLSREDAAPPPLPATPTPTEVTHSPTATPTRTASPTPTGSPTASSTQGPRPSGTASPTSAPTRSGTPRPTSTPTPTRSPRPTSTPSPVLTRGTPKISADQFLTAAQWNDATTLGTRLESWRPAEAGVGAVSLCDPNADVAPAAMSWFKGTGDSSWWGAERIQSSNLQSNGSTNATEPAAIVRAWLGDSACTSTTDPVVSLERGPREGTLAVTSEYPGGAGPVTDLVGAVALPDGTSTATFVLSGTDADSRGWEFLGNLMDAAARG